MNLTDRLAAELLRRGDVPYEHAKLMTAAQMISLYECHHNIRRAEGGNDHFTNLEHMLRSAHRERTRKIDVPAIAKNKRVRTRHLAHLERMRAKETKVT